MGVQCALTGAELWQNVIQNNRRSWLRMGPPRAPDLSPLANRLLTKLLP
jgi:hypothetical protein